MRSTGAPLRVLHVIHTLGDGGADRALTRLVSHADPREMSHAIVTLAPGPGHLALPHDVQIETVTSGRDLRAALDVLLSARFARPDVVHGWVSFPAVVAAAFSAAVGIPLVLRQPTNIEEELRWNRGGVAAYWRELRAAFALADCVVIPSPVLEAGTRRVYDVGRVVSIPNAIETDVPERWTATARRGRTRFVVAFVGRLVDQKNPLLLLRALDRLRDAVDWELRVFGDGALRGAMDALIASAGMGDRVRFMGFRCDWRAAVAEFDAFVLPTRFEGMCNTLLEAAAAGLPIVTTDIPENRFLLGPDEALLVASDDVGGFAQAIARLAGDGDLGARLGRHAVAIPGRFTATAMTRAHEAVYREVAGKTDRRRRAA